MPIEPARRTRWVASVFSCEAVPAVGGISPFHVVIATFSTTVTRQWLALVLHAPKMLLPTHHLTMAGVRCRHEGYHDDGSICLEVWSST